jgi:hypothetical protein
MLADVERHLGQRLDAAEGERHVLHRQQALADAPGVRGAGLVGAVLGLTRGGVARIAH